MQRRPLRPSEGDLEGCLQMDRNLVVKMEQCFRVMSESYQCPISISFPLWGKDPPWEEHIGPWGVGKWPALFLPRPRAFYLHRTFGVEDGPRAFRTMWRSHPVFACTQGDVRDATTGQLGGWGDLTSPGPRAGSTASAPQTQLPLEGGGGWAEGGKGPVFPVEGAKDQLYPCLARALPGAPGKWPGNGAHPGKAPFPRHLHPMFPALEHEGPHISHRLN